MPVITISRQYGSGGIEVAKRLCEVLGYTYFDKNLMALVASELDVSEGEVVDLSEDTYKMRSFFERLFGRRHVRTDVADVRAGEADLSVSVESLNEESSIDLVRQTILEAHKQDNVVIVGRGGQAILREHPRVLHVRLTAPLGARALRVKERADCPLSEATEYTQRKDMAASAYLERFYDIDWENPMLYHLMLNMGKWGVEDATQIILNALSHLRVATR